MLNSFEISYKDDKQYKYKFEIKDDLLLYYNHDNLFNKIIENEKIFVCYGYCFDVREPRTDISDTLKALAVNSENLYEELKYLNGHYILLFNVSNRWKLITDAVGMTPVHYDTDQKRVVTHAEEDLPSLNGFLVLDLEDFTIERIATAVNKLKDERLERVVLDLVKDQYKYFTDKNITINFRRNRMNKAIISILHPSLFGQTLNLRENDALTEKVASQLAREYKMSVVNEAEEIGTFYVGNTHLMDYKLYISKSTETEEEKAQPAFNDFKIGEDEHQERGIIEYGLQHHLRYRKEKRNYLFYDPFNVPAIQERIYHYIDDKTFDPLKRIISILHPSIDFYDFAEGKTLLKKFNDLRKENKKMLKEVQNRKQNAEFLSNAKVKGIEVTDNLDGKVMEDGISFYPAKQSISKGEVFEVLYKKKGQGMILIESYFDNPKNAHRIKVDVNGEADNIDAFLDGKFINVNSDVSLKMTYERDYDAVSWQKAGKITIKEID